MPVSSPLTPKSVLRHRPLDSKRTTRVISTVTRASRPPQVTKKIVPPVASSPQVTKRIVPPIASSPQITNVKKGSSQINLTSLGIGMVVAVLAVLLGQFALGWLGTTWDDLHYGRPRTFQTDAFVGHEAGHTPSHFIVLNLHGRIEILEQPGGDATKMRVYLGPQITGPGADLVPVTLQFVDPHKTHHPDMILHFQDTQFLFRNVQGTFQVGQP